MTNSNAKFGGRMFLVVLLALASVSVVAARDKSHSTSAIPAFPGTLVNATYVYVTSYDGDQFNPNLFPEDRKAIDNVQDAMQRWGKFVVVYKPQDADIVLMVMSRPSEDVLAVYDAHGWPGSNQYLWRMMGRAGLQSNELPLMTNLEKAYAAATTK